jgi:hypothetical protein
MKLASKRGEAALALQPVQGRPHADKVVETRVREAGVRIALPDGGGGEGLQAHAEVGVAAAQHRPPDQAPDIPRAQDLAQALPPPFLVVVIKDIHAVAELPGMLHGAGFETSQLVGAADLRAVRIGPDKGEGLAEVAASGGPDVAHEAGDPGI